MTKFDKNEIEIYRKAIRLIKKGYGGGYVPKHGFDLDISCIKCQSAIVVSFLENAIALMKYD